MHHTAKTLANQKQRCKQQAISDASMAEWSKAVDLRPTIERCEGSNPSRRKRQQPDQKATAILALTSL